MKIFKDWKEDDIPSFIMFLAKESQRQKSKMRSYFKKIQKDGDVHFSVLYEIHKGCAIQSDTAYRMAKFHFKYDKRKC